MLQDVLMDFFHRYCSNDLSKFFICCLINSSRFIFVTRCILGILCACVFYFFSQFIRFSYACIHFYTIGIGSMFRTVKLLFTRPTLNAHIVLCNENLIIVHINKRKFQCWNPFEFHYIQIHNSNILKML